MGIGRMGRGLGLRAVLLAAACWAGAAAAGEREVLEEARAFADPDRSAWHAPAPRALRIVLWRPATGAAEGPLPLVMLSHGATGRAAHMAWLGRELAAHGYLAAAVEHSGSVEEERGSQPLSLADFYFWERPRDLSVALDRLLADPQLGPRIDPRRIGAAGFSLGATSVLLLAGPRLDRERLQRDPNPPALYADLMARHEALGGRDPVVNASMDRAESSHRDPRVRAIFGLAPAVGHGFNADTLAQVAVPVHLVVGDADPVTPAAANAGYFAGHIPGAGYTVLPGERGHYLGPGDEALREAEMAEVAALALAFFDRTLSPAATAER